jgi:hypothetical protein
MAQSNVYSLNVVGYVNKSLPVGLTLVATPLNTTNNTVGGLLGGVGGALPDGTQVYVWNATGGTYIIGTRDDTETTGWGSGFETQDLSPGKGYFIKNNTAAAVTVTFVGEVLQGKLTNHVGTGYQLLASQVPQPGQVDSDLFFPVADGDQVYIWKNATASYSIYTADTTLEPPPWGGTNNAPKIDVAEGFFSRKAAAVDWTRDFTVQ